MKIRAHIFTFLLFAVMLILALFRPSPALAVSTITSTSGGDGVFLLQGIGIEDAAALEITVQYDTATLANPRVTAGPLIAGAMSAINPNVPGTVRMVMIRLTPVKGSGVIATLAFDLKGPSPGKIISINAKLANSQGTNLPVLVQVNNPSDVPKTDPSPAPTQESRTGTAMTSPTIAPTIIIAGSSEKPLEAKVTPDIQGTKTLDDRPLPQEPVREPREEQTLMARKTESASAAGDTAARAKTSKREIHTQKSILDRFQEYTGKRTPEACISLFERDSMFWYRQDPPVALSDGKTAVRATFISTPGNKTSSDVMVTGAKLISLKPDPDNTNTWVVELMPDKGTYRASIAVSHGDGSMVYPLTIAPEVVLDRSQSGAMTKAQFDRYFSERGTAREPGSDANKDGKRDFIDDYIVTANYLAAAEAAQNRKPN